MFDSYIKFSKLFSQIAGIAAAFMILVAVLITVEMIWVRFVLNYSTAWQTETVIYLMVGATLIGLAYVQVLRGHVNVDLLPMLIKPKFKKILACLTSLISIVIVFFMFIYGFDYWYVAYEKNWTSDTVTAVPLKYPYFALPLGFGLFLNQLIADFISMLTNRDLPFDKGSK
ncbi:TRAP transporter small permease [Alphaproteobacteria bacterium]|nr:TRAP transporter small permease [Alphaproteobacteria bacterium]